MNFQRFVQAAGWHPRYHDVAMVIEKVTKALSVLQLADRETGSYAANVIRPENCG
jgi:hypothetical protein